MNKNLVPFKKIIEKNGYKFTLQKQLILEVILESKIHLNAKEIYEKIKIKNIGLATVYRNLKIFDELGIVKVINISGNSYYEMKIFSKKPFHIYLKCYKCDNIVDIDSQEINLQYLKLNKNIEEKNNIEIYDTDITFLGLCSKCREDEKWQDQPNLEE